MEGAWNDEYASQCVSKVLDGKRIGPPDLQDKIGVLMHRRYPPTPEQKHYTPEHAAESIRWKIDDLIHKVAKENALDRSAVYFRVLREIALASFRMSERPNDVLTIIMDAADEFKKSRWTGD